MLCQTVIHNCINKCLAVINTLRVLPLGSASVPQTYYINYII